MGDISKGVANTLQPAKNIQKKIHTKAEDSFWDIVFLNPLQLFIIF
jgi:hypothetical protein